ncbi:MAG: hypothetical protein JWO05_1258 [Gemmatimonadetes bacterium]|nr:hypothetical protein [Gemmatimonadota bacterium]
MTLVDVALPLPLFRTFTYALAEGQSAVRGQRVLVPVRGRKEIGIVVGEGTAKEGLKLKSVLAVPDAAPLVSESLLALSTWIADYYVVPIGIVLRTILPALLTGAGAPVPHVKERRVVVQSGELPSLQQRDAFFARAPQQRALFELVEQLGGRAPLELLLERMHFSPSVLKGLVARSMVVVEGETVARDPFARRAAQAPTTHVPSAAQEQAIAALAAANKGDVFLLHGVTGSGKTLVYIEFLKTVIARGQGAIVLVPEIALTPQAVDRFRAVFGNSIAVLHSALSDGERYDEWQALQRGDKRIAVGARSAIFAPIANLGAIVVDEEHESSYKQGESPRYHAREVAIVRARAEGAVVVLGSATPGLESWVNAASGKYTLLTLPERAGGAQLPKVEIVDLRTIPRDPQEPAEAFFTRTVLTPRLEAALAARLERGEQSILLLNRRGYASFVQCAGCGDVATCRDCSISLTYHRSPERLVCHYCLHAEEPRATCARCGEKLVKQKGLGTQQVERLLGERYPSARIARMDVDTTSGKWAHTEILDRMGAGEIDILLGTQMIAKGLDFPNVTLVGVVDADIGINLPDFRASERCFQLLAQVAGRAGRGPKGGEVLIQTRAPSHHAVRCAVTHDYHGFVRQELDGRRHPTYPPNVRLVNVVLSGTTEAATEELASGVAAWIGRLLVKQRIGDVIMVGPAPCPVERLKTRWRWHLLLKSANATELTRVCRYFLQRFEVPNRAGLRVTLDRDPVNLM